MNALEKLFSLEGKTAIVTGGAQGIGSVVAMRMAEVGANIVIFDMQEEKARKTAKEIAEATGKKTAAYGVDVTDPVQVKAAIEQADADMGGLDLLFNNAGIVLHKSAYDVTPVEWAKVINVNLKSAFNFIHACTPVMMRQKAGSIINMASVVGVHGNAGQANYAASKAGMIALAKSIAQELGSRGIRANAIAPGFILTDMTAALSDEVRAEWAKKIPLRRGGTPEDVANIATFLASDMSSYVSGQVIQVDGGMNM